VGHFCKQWGIDGAAAAKEAMGDAAAAKKTTAKKAVDGADAAKEAAAKKRAEGWHLCFTALAVEFEAIKPSADKTK
jgi:hypothetical protein